MGDSVWDPTTPGPLPPRPTPGDPPPPPPPMGIPRLIPVTTAQDGEFHPRFYSYWPNAWIGPDGMAYVFAGHVDGHPRCFSVDLNSASVVRLQQMAIAYAGTTEGWYWDPQGWIYLIHHDTLHRVNPFTGDDQLVVDISASYPGHVLHQAHSSDDGRTHCMTVQQVVAEGAYPAVGTLVVRDGVQRPLITPLGTLDESQVTPDGYWLVIKETIDGELCNRILELDSGEEQLLRKAQGAVGHSDCGFESLVGEWSPPPGPDQGACVAWDLSRPLVPELRRTLFNTWNMGHVSVRAGRCLLSDGAYLSLVGLDGSGVTPLIAHGMVVQDPNRAYDYQVRANLDPSGRVACFMSNFGRDRFDVALLVL